MKISRRDFLKYASASAATLGLSQLQVGKLGRALAQTAGAPVIWLSGAGCTGCSISLLNTVSPTIDSLLTTSVSLKYHSTLMAAAGDLAVAAARTAAQAGGYILVVEGAIPTAASGKYCIVWDEGGVPVAMTSALTSLAANARYVVAAGTCASYGGIPRSYALPGAQGVGTFLGRSIINLPGCPVHPDWLVGTLSQLIIGSVPALDSNGRPTAYYGRTIHNRCPRRSAARATQLGQDGRCLRNLGCKGPNTYGDCGVRLWNNKQNWCVGANGLCLGCTQPDFPRFPLHV